MKPTHLFLTVALVAGIAGPAFAQQGRVQGTVRDTSGDAIKGAVIRATNPDAVPREITSTTDDRGRFAILGMRLGTWQFTVEAPGFFAVQGNSPVRTTLGAPMQFVLNRDPGVMPGALARNIQVQVSAANSLREQGRLDDAIAAYQGIQQGNTRLTMVQLVLADLYRTKASRETNPAERRALLERAVAAYGEILKADATSDRARTEMAAATADLKLLQP